MISRCGVGWLLAIGLSMGTGWLLGRDGDPRPAAGDGDLQAIEKLHQRDIAATLARDPQALADLFTEDAVLLEPGDPALVGKPTILAENKKEMVAHPTSKVLSYKPEIKDLKIVGGWAFEWDYFDASYRESDRSEVRTFRAKALRILRREPDGSWKFARVMWNLAEGE